MLFPEKKLNSQRNVPSLRVSQIPKKVHESNCLFGIPEKSGLLPIVTAKLLQKHGLSR
jgi:hypothetical protein